VHAEGGDREANVHDDASGIRKPPLTFGDRFAEQVLRRESQIVVGLDPDPMRLWSDAVELMGGVDKGSAPPAARAARAVARHCELVIDAVAAECAFVKPQLACFERLGAPGWAALARVVEIAQASGLLVIADAKRGDIDVTARAYAQAFLGETETPFGTVSGLGADAMTLSPLLGTDSLLPYIDAARPRARGLFVLTRNSNPSAAEFQDLEVGGGPDSTLSARFAEMIARVGRDGVGSHGIADIGAVIGATAPHKMARLRALMPHTPVLVPGVGAQGGQISDLAPLFEIGPAGAVINSSRGIVNAYEKRGGKPADAARSEAASLREQAWNLSAPSH
jgi:orotidine-5'-phosphate decarboxylase